MKLLIVFLLFNILSFWLGYRKNRKERDRLLTELTYAIMTAKLKEMQLKLNEKGVVKL